MTTTGTTKIEQRETPAVPAPVENLRAPGKTKARKWAALGATLALMLAAAVAFGEEPTACREAYLVSGLAQQQVSLEEFRELYADTICAAER